MKVPLIVRAVLLGFGVSTLGVGIWVILITNLPGPWPVVGMGAILILYYMYFSGRWKPGNTQAFRRFCMRRNKLKRVQWIWGLLASFFLFIFVSSGLVFTFRMVEFQPEVFKTFSYLNDLPPWQAWSVTLGISMVAGVCEEIGFRGYMQKPLEQKYGPVAAISITSLVFVVVHLHQAWAGGILVQIFVISSMIGYLAYATNSLIPGILAHISFDIINVSYWWSDILGTFEHKPIGITGIDIHFIVALIVVLLSMGWFIVAIRRLLKLKSTDSADILYRSNRVKATIIKT